MATRAERIKDMEQKLKELKAQEAAKQRREKRAAEKKARQERQRFALSFLEFCETHTVNMERGSSVNIYAWISSLMQRENPSVPSEGGDV